MCVDVGLLDRRVILAFTYVRTVRTWCWDYVYILLIIPRGRWVKALLVVESNTSYI